MLWRTEFALFCSWHYHQFENVPLRNFVSKEVVADFHLGKDLLFAEMNMTDREELQAFRQLSELCAKKVASADVLIFLSAPISLIVDRVRARGRDFEQKIPIPYYAALIAKYEQFYEHYVGGEGPRRYGRVGFRQAPRSPKEPIRFGKPCAFWRSRAKWLKEQIGPTAISKTNSAKD